MVSVGSHGPCPKKKKALCVFLPFCHLAHRQDTNEYKPTTTSPLISQKKKIFHSSHSHSHFPNSLRITPHPFQNPSPSPFPILSLSPSTLSSKSILLLLFFFFFLAVWYGINETAWWKDERWGELSFAISERKNGGVCHHRCFSQ